MSVKAGLSRIARPDAKLFLLGSLPGDASLSQGRYYAHPSNQFWRLLGTVIGEEIGELSYEERLARLMDRRIGLWDVIASARRQGSLDQAIREAQHNSVDRLQEDFPHLKAIGFNGATAAAAGRKLLGTQPVPIALLDLPSSSAANTRPFLEKAKEWSVLKEFVGP